MSKRRAAGTGTVYQAADGRWIAAIYAGRRKVVRARWSEADAEAAILEMIEKHALELGYYYAGVSGGRRHPELRQKQAPRSGVTLRVRWQVFERDGYRCVYCGATPADCRLVIDHIQPVADGGTDDTGNLATACQDCNAGKAERPLLILPPALASRAIRAE